MNSEDDIFLKQMRGVNPIKKNNRIKKEEPKTTYLTNKQHNTKQHNTKQHNTNTPTPIKKTKQSEFYLEKLGLRKGIKKRSINIDKKIDFHGKTLLESEEKFANIIQDCYNNGQRCLLFVTGKRLFKSKEPENNNQPKLYHGVIRSSFFHWVKSNKFSKYILAYEQASSEHGGDGAFYVYLRKKKN